MLPQKAGAVGASGMIAPMPTMAMGCRPGLSDWVANCGLEVISLGPSRGRRAGAPVQDIGDAVHVGYQPLLRRARGVDLEAVAQRGAAGGLYATGSSHPPQPVAGHFLGGVAGEHP